MCLKWEWVENKIFCDELFSYKVRDRLNFIRSENFK